MNHHHHDIPVLVVHQHAIEKMMMLVTTHHLIRPDSLSVVWPIIIWFGPGLVKGFRLAEAEGRHLNNRKARPGAWLALL